MNEVLHLIAEMLSILTSMTGIIWSKIYMDVEENPQIITFNRVRVTVKSISVS